MRATISGESPSHEVLRPDIFSKASQAHVQLAALPLCTMQVVCRASPSKWIVVDHHEHRWPVGYERRATAETVGRLCQQGQLAEAVEALGVLVLTDCRIPQLLFNTVVKNCVDNKDLCLGRRAHALSVRKGYQSDTFLCNHILRMYASRGRLQEAVDVFTMVAEPDAFTWSAIISAHVKHGQDKLAVQLYQRMRGSSVKPDAHVFVAALQACGRARDLEAGQQVHADLLASGVEPNLVVASCLVDMYGKCGSVEEAQGVFDRLRQKNVVTWSAMIAGYAQKGMGHEALLLYSAMQAEGLAAPNSVTFVSLLQACAGLGTPALEEGRHLHAQIRERGLQADVVVGGSLVNMYSKCGSLKDARDVFDSLGERNVVSWNAMIAGYTQHGMGQEALALHQAMLYEGSVAPDGVTLVCLLQACASIGHPALEKGRQLHAYMRERGLEGDAFVANSLVNMYAKCGSIEDAQRVFDGLPQKDVVTWNAMVAGYSQSGMELKALNLLSAMQEEGMSAPNAVTFVSVLQACGSLGTTGLEKGKQLHALIREQGLQADVCLANSLVDMYAKCGSLEDAQGVFDGMSKKDVGTWNALIAGYSKNGKGLQSLQLLIAMREECVSAPNSVTFVPLLQACAIVGTLALDNGKQLHAQIREQGLQGDLFVANSLVNMYAKCGSLEDAHGVFDGLVYKNVVTWNTMIAGYSHADMGEDALRLYADMQEEGIVTPNSGTFVSLLQACASIGTSALEKGKQLHALVREQGLQDDLFVANSLINMYGKCGSLEDAQRVFVGLGQKNVVTWSALIAGYSQQGMGQEALGLYTEMQEQGALAPNSVMFVTLLHACASVGTPALEKGRQLHAQIRAQGLQADESVANSLVYMYAECGSLVDAEGLFDLLGQKSVLSWNAMIAGYSRQGMWHNALRLYGAMQDYDINGLGSGTFVSLLQACASGGTSTLETGRQLHAQISKQGLQADLFVASSLLNMYAKCGSIEDARAVFDGLEEKNVVTWSAMVAGYSQQGRGQDALSLYSAMQEGGTVTPNAVTFVSLLQACANMGPSALETGKQLHAQIRGWGHEVDVVVASSLVHMYAKCGSLQDAWNVFHGLPQKHVGTWNAMIAGHSQQGMAQEALGLYRLMQREGKAAPDSVTYVCLLQACAEVAALHLGRELHAQITQQGLQSDVVVASALIDMYGKCGSMVDAQQAFDSLPQRDIVTWNALIAGFARQGNSDAVLDLFHRVKEDAREPSGSTFLSVLTVCSHTGLVTVGREYFQAMKLCGISPSVEHYTCMVDLLGRAGHLHEALHLARTMPVPPDSAVWHTLLGACQKWRDTDVGLHAFDEALKLDKKDSAAYVLMSNIYAGVEMWQQAQEIQTWRRGIGAWKEAGQSWWTDMDGLVHCFVAGDRTIPPLPSSRNQGQVLSSSREDHSPDHQVPNLNLNPK